MQQKNESSREFISRWNEIKNACEGVSETQAIHAFKQSLRKGATFRFMIYSDESETLGGLLACANKYAAADDDNREEGETRRRESGKKKVEDQAGPSNEAPATIGKGDQVTQSGRTKNRQATDQPDRQR